MKFIKSFLFNISLFLVLDIVWFKFIAGHYFKDILSPIARMKDGEFDINIGSAFVVYILMSLALDIFVLQKKIGTFGKVIQSAFLGFVIYGVFDFTNHALLNNYPQEMLVVDVLWGTFLFAIVAYVRCRMAPKRLFLDY